MASHQDDSHPAAAAALPDNVYHPHDVLDETAKTAVVGLGAGFFLAAVQNALSKRNLGAFGVFSRGGPIIGLAGMYLSSPIPANCMLETIRRRNITRTPVVAVEPIRPKRTK